MSKFAYVTGVLMLIASPAIAQTSAMSTAGTDAKKSDAGRLICQKEDKVGSRLAAKKVCLTVKEWQDRAQFNREETERVQRDTTPQRSN